MSLHAVKAKCLEVRLTPSDGFHLCRTVLRPIVRSMFTEPDLQWGIRMLKLSMGMAGLGMSRFLGAQDGDITETLGHSKGGLGPSHASGIYPFCHSSHLLCVSEMHPPVKTLSP